MALSAAIGVLLLAVLAAVVVPARRAVRVQPVDALRSE
jgi:ABC-type antimicrobial peptide transport system permease subunit